MKGSRDERLEKKVFAILSIAACARINWATADFYA
jgi:hypothetical protein